MLDMELLKNVTQIVAVANIFIALRIGYRYYVFTKGYGRENVTD